MPDSHPTEPSSLEASEARFRAALSAGRMGSWETDRTTGKRYWSQEGMDLFGLDLAGGIGTVGGPNDEYVAAIHPEDRHHVQRFQELSARQDSFPAEYRIVKPDGSTLWLSGRGMVVSRGPDGAPLRLISIMADATERKLAEEQLRLERERLTLAFGVGQMGAYDMNLRDGTLWWSPETYALFGVDPARFVPIPDTVLSLIHPDDRTEFSRLRSLAIDTHRPFIHEFRIRRPNGVEAWVGHRGQADYDAQGTPVRSFGITMDITERKKNEALLRDADRRKDIFIAVLAHELRNPLAPIRNAIAVLRKLGTTDDKADWCHDVIDRQVTQMTRLLDDLLDVSRLSRGALRLRMMPLTLSDILSHALEIARPFIDAGGHSLRVHPAAVVHEVEGDLTRLAQVFSNILINAAKYTPRGGSIELKVVSEADGVVVTIADSGIGIAAENLAKVFELFGQLEQAGDGPQGGQGIGLSLAKDLVEMHGGTIRALSAGPGKGSSFEVRLPVLNSGTAVGVATPDMRGAEASPHAGAHDDKYHILIADDSKDAAETYALLLQDMGHRVDVAHDGEQALRLAESLRPEVLLLDLGMPKIDGLELCRRIRAAPWGRQMLLIAQTGWGQAEDRRRTREAGFDHHLVKPIEMEALESLLRRK